MAAVKKDIEKYIKNTFERKTKDLYLGMLKDVEDYEYDYDQVDAPAAMGDTHKSSCSYTIKGYTFEYHHINGDGGIFSAEFTVEHNDKKEKIVEYSEFAEMAKRFGKKVKLSQQNDLFNEVIGLYNKKIDIQTYHNFFGILNAFTFGQCAMIFNGKVDTIGFDFE